MTGDDLRDFVDRKLIPYLHGFKEKATGPNTIEYKIGEIFAEIKNKFSVATTSAKSSTTSTSCASVRKPKSTSYRISTKPKFAIWATRGATGANTTPRVP